MVLLTAENSTLWTLLVAKEVGNKSTRCTTRHQFGHIDGSSKLSNVHLINSDLNC